MGRRRLRRAVGVSAQGLRCHRSPVSITQRRRGPVMSSLPCDKRSLRRYVRAGFLERNAGAEDVRQMWQRLDASARSLSERGVFKGKRGRPRHAACWAEWLRLRKTCSIPTTQDFRGARMSDAKIVVRRRLRFSVVADQILEARSLSFAARDVLAWALGRQDGFDCWVWYT